MAVQLAGERVQELAEALLLLLQVSHSFSEVLEFSSYPSRHHRFLPDVGQRVFSRAPRALWSTSDYNVSLWLLVENKQIIEIDAHICLSILCIYIKQ